LSDEEIRRCEQIATWCLAQGNDEDHILVQLERLKFETIVSGRSYAQVLDELVPTGGS
jgi:hypothetical protein